MEAIILAGGLGTRLRSRISDLPKSMAPVGGRPFLRILLDQLLDQGCQRIILSVGYRRQAILDAFGETYRGLQLHYVVEEAPLGTGGAIRFALQHTQNPFALVLNGDTYLDSDFSAMLLGHAAANRPITMAVTRVDEMARYGGVVIRDGRVAGFIEKGRTGPGWINGGAYVMNRSFPWSEGLPSSFSFESDVLARSLNDLQPAAFPCRGQFLDIGTPDDLDRAQTVLLPRD